MNSSLDERKKIAQVWRAGRMLAGKTQAQLAQAIEIPQSSISKYETMNLEPSASDWFRFCQYVGIDAHKTLSLGFIDSKTKFKAKLYSASLFNLPMKYRRDFSLKIRELIPFKAAIVEELGPEAWSEFVKTHKIDQDMFAVFDFQVSFELFLDLLSWTKNKDIDLLTRASYHSANLANHGLLKESFHGKTEIMGCLKKWVESQSYYQSVIKAELNSIDGQGTVAFSYHPPILDFYDPDVLSKFRDYKATSFNDLLLSQTTHFKGFKISERAEELFLRTRVGNS